MRLFYTSRQDNVDEGFSMYVLSFNIELGVKYKNDYPSELSNIRISNVERASTRKNIRVPDGI